MLPKRARFLAEPPPNRLQISAFLLFRHMQNTLDTLLRVAKDFGNLGEAAAYTLSTCLAQKYPNSSSQNTKEQAPADQCQLISFSVQFPCCRTEAFSIKAHVLP